MILYPLKKNYVITLGSFRILLKEKYSGNTQKKYFVAFFVFLLIGIQNLIAQQNMPAPVGKVYRVAVFAPMYLDSAFTAGNLKSNTIPKFIMPGVDFSQGAQLGFDTLALYGKRLEVFLYDSKSYYQPISWLIQNKKLDSIDLIIGSVKEPEYSELAQFAVQRNVPFVSSTYPNDGGIRGNPFTIIVNSTLKAHCEGIFSYILQKHGTDNIYLIKKKNDNRIDNYFKEINTSEGKPLLKIKTIMLDSSISSYGLSYLVDTTRPIVIIGASLDETFSRKLADACYPISKTNPLILIGMPNWDGFRSLQKKDAYKDFPILFTTPHYENKNNAFENFLVDNYFLQYRIKPSDMAYKGFESAYYFSNILLHFGKNFMEHLNESQFAVFHDFNFRPVYNYKNSIVPDYFENKHLFMMKILNGNVAREW